MERILCCREFPCIPQIRAAVFDFDGTLSTLRCGWEKIMRQLMLSVLSPGKEPTAALAEKVDRYIDESTGIQTIYQMEWLAQEVQAETGAPALDPWDYKAQYNTLLMQQVELRKRRLETGEASAEEYLVPGSLWFLRYLRDAGIKIYIASGTDDEDLQKEVTLLGVTPLICRAKGAPHRQKSCSKEAVLREILQTEKTPPENLLVVGDGKVEIALGNQAGAVTLGVASDERNFSGDFHPKKLEKLKRAGADCVIPDFTVLQNVLPPH